MSDIQKTIAGLAHLQSTMLTDAPERRTVLAGMRMIKELVSELENTRRQTQWISVDKWEVKSGEDVWASNINTGEVFKAYFSDFIGWSKFGPLDGDVIVTHCMEIELAPAPPKEQGK